MQEMCFYIGQNGEHACLEVHAMMFWPGYRVRSVWDLTAPNEINFMKQIWASQDNSHKPT